MHGPGGTGPMSPDVFSSPVIEGMILEGGTSSDVVIVSDVISVESSEASKVPVRKSRIPNPSGGQLEARQGRNVVGNSRIPSPTPWEAAMKAVGDAQKNVLPEQSFTAYVNPLAEDYEEEECLSSVEEKENTGNVGKAVSFHMQTPEAVQILHKISGLRSPLSKKSENFLGCYLRTGPKKLSPEPSKEYDIMVPKLEGSGRLYEKLPKTTMTQVSGTRNVVDVVENGTKNKNRARDESSEDENHISDGEERGAQARDEQDGVVTIASPVAVDGKMKHHQNDVVYNSPEEVPPTLNPGLIHKAVTRNTSPVVFNLGSPSEDGSDNGEQQKSFSFGMGGGGGGLCPAHDGNVTACLVAEAQEDSTDESVDQPNPFASMLGRLRDEPATLQSPIIGKSHPVTPGDEDAQDSPKSPSHCTPMNLISVKSLTMTPPLGQGDVQKWMEHRGLDQFASTPTRKDLAKMWDALKHIQDATAAYQDAMRKNAQLQEDLTELRQAEAEARLDAEREHQIAVDEMAKSNEISAQMMELSTSVYKVFARCEDERRVLSEELEQARKALNSAHDSAGNGTQLKELETLREELEMLRRAEATARAEAENAKRICREYQESLEQVHMSMASMQLKDMPSLNEESQVKCKVSYFEALAQHVGQSLEIAPGPESETPLGRLENALVCIEDPMTGFRAPQTTPVDIDDTTTPYRLHLEAINALRHSIQGTPIIEEADSDSDYEVEEISVSPVEVDGMSRSGLRERVRDRLSRLRTDLQDARSRLNHVEQGLHYTKETTPDVVKLESESPVSVSRAADSVEQDTGFLHEETNEPSVALPDEDQEDTFLPKDVRAREEEEVEQEEGEFLIPASMVTPGSSRSRFARRLEALNTPGTRQKAAFTPMPSLSAMKTTAHFSPRFSSSASNSSPSVFFEPLSRPRVRRGYMDRKRSESDEKEFRRRAAALKIHVSPYFKRKKSSLGQERQEIDTIV